MNHRITAQTYIEGMKLTYGRKYSVPLTAQQYHKVYDALNALGVQLGMFEPSDLEKADKEIYEYYNDTINDKLLRHLNGDTTMLSYYGATLTLY